MRQDRCSQNGPSVLAPAVRDPAGGREPLHSTPARELRDLRTTAEVDVLRQPGFHVPLQRSPTVVAKRTRYRREPARRRVSLRTRDRLPPDDPENRSAG